MSSDSNLAPPAWENVSPHGAEPRSLLRLATGDADGGGQARQFNNRLWSEGSRWVRSPLRRAIDCWIAAVALIAVLPMLLLVAIAVRLDSDGPILFRQNRIGRGGREFTLYKFRSMHVQKGKASCITVKGDMRVTRVGRLLRRFKFDELPQFWNVFVGDMGLVGPRPKLPHHEALHMAYRPGITGVATLAFADEEEILSGIPAEELDGYYDRVVKPAKAQLDFEYMQSATFISDLRIVWQTAVCVFSNESQRVTKRLLRRPVEKPAVGKVHLTEFPKRVDYQVSHLTCPPKNRPEEM